jgi:hypothetical protein
MEVDVVQVVAIKKRNEKGLPYLQGAPLDVMRAVSRRPV